MPKKITWRNLLIISIIFLVCSLIFAIIFNINKKNNDPYYKISGTQLHDFTTVTQKQQWSSNNPGTSIRLYAKRKVQESFVAKNDNLGIVAVPFDTNNKSVLDRVIFRIKKTGENGWYIQSTYNADQFQNNIPFPFGFPVIKNSKHVSYTFEIESLNGTAIDSLAVSKANNFFFPKYKFSGAEIIKNPYVLLDFLTSKLLEHFSMLTTGEIILITLFSLSPFIAYWLLTLLEISARIPAKKVLRKKINTISGYLSKTTLIKRRIVLFPLDRDLKIKLCSLIVSVGFFSAVLFHYLQGLFFKRDFPLSSFIPNWFFGDFFVIFDQWIRFKFNGMGNYFPGTYLLIDLFTRFFPNPYTAVFVYLTIFTLFMLFFTYKNVKTDSIIESLQSAFIISLMSYPFLFVFQTANLEIITFISISLFFLLYSKNRLLSVIFLSYAISMKIFPGIFLILLFLEKRFKDIFLTCLFTILFTLLPLIIFDGGFNKGMGNYMKHLKEGQQFYMDFMVLGESGYHYGHSLLNSLRAIFPGYIPMQPIIFPYTIFVLISVSVLIGYLIFFEKIFWRKVAVLVMMTDLFPFTSTDYKLLYVFLPLFLLINHAKKDKYDSVFIVLLSLLIIPKNYFYFNNNPYASFTIIANTVLMLIVLLLIICLGLRSSKLSSPRWHRKIA